MSERCPQCDAMCDDAGVPPGGHLRCARCSTRFIKARPRGAGVAEPVRWRTDDQSAAAARKLGIHPALAGKRATGEAAAKTPASPWNVADDNGNADLSDTLPGEPAPPSEPALEAPPKKPPPPRMGPPVAAAPPPVPFPPPSGPPLGHGASPRVADPGATSPGRPGRKSHEAVQNAQRPAPRKPPPAPQPNDDVAPVIPGYEVTELVGKGAMGRVYRARQAATGRSSAIKLLAPELAAREDFIQRFEREGAAMRAVHHPGVVAVMDGGSARQPDGTTAYYICMEFVEGPPLRRHLDKGALSPERALRFARLVIQGLGAAHAKGVIHRDLKPENILAPPAAEGEERLVIVDFGLAGILNEEDDPHPNLTKSRMTMGTVNYMAPEQRTDAKRVDQRADLYAAGVILYELLTGDLPLGRFALPTERGVPVPAAVDRCIVRALARNPDERYQTAAQFDDELRTIEAELRRSAGQHTIIGRARPPGGGSDGSGGHKLHRSIFEDSGAGPLASVASGGTATAWMTSAPWVRRSSLLWAALLLTAGAGLALVSKILGVLP